MPVGKPTDQHIKTEVITKIRDEGMRVVDAASDYGISTKTIYRWLRDGVVNSNTSLILENNRLKKEIEQLYNMLGRAAVELKRPKR